MVTTPESGSSASRGAKAVSDKLSQLKKSVQEFIESGDYENAYSRLVQLLDSEHVTGDLANTAGLIALKLEYYEDAAKLFQTALELEPEHVEAGYNLAILESSKGDTASAIKRLRRLSLLDSENPSFHNDLAVLWQQEKRYARSEVEYRRALRIDPNNSLARNNALQLLLDHASPERGRKLLDDNEKSTDLTSTSRAEIHRWREILSTTGNKTSQIHSFGKTEKSIVPAIGNIILFSSQASFVKPIMDELSARNNVRYYDAASGESVDEALRWADLAWLEWCDEIAINVASREKQCRTICRLHSYEAFTDMPDRMNWGNIDQLILVSDAVKDLLGNRLPANLPVRVIHNGVDLDRFSIPKNKKYGKKIASVGYINYKKNPSLLLYCFKKIYEYDPEYSLHIAGVHQDSRIELYFSHFLRRNPLPVHFHGWVDDMSSWYEDKDFVISTSLFESFHYSIAEGMTSGLMPLIHDWYGSSTLYPSEFLFADPDSCLSLLHRIEDSDRETKALSNRLFIAERYESNKQLEKIYETLGLLMTGSNSK